MKGHLAKMCNKKGKVQPMRYLKSGLHFEYEKGAIWTLTGNLKDRPWVDQVFKSSYFLR